MSASSNPKLTAKSRPPVIQKIRILGIDPGSRLTGYGVVDLVGSEIRHVAHGTLKLAATGGRQEVPLERRLLDIHKGLTEVIETFRPDLMSIERVFFAKNAVSALKLGQARGAAILCGAIHGLQVVEYSPTEVKSAIVGHGQADKEQVARMLEMLFGKQDFASSDASDGLALAVCHARISGSHSSLGKTPQNTLQKRGSKKKMTLAQSLEHVARAQGRLTGKEKP